jgi:hypothetical protein
MLGRMTTTTPPEPVTVNRLHLVAIKHGLLARQRGLYITSPAKGGSTKNLLQLLGNITGQKYPNSRNGIETALYHIGVILTQTMTEEHIAAAEEERQRLIERSRAVSHN